MTVYKSFSGTWCEFDGIHVSTRLYNILVNEGYSTWKQLAGLDERELTLIYRMGKGSLEELKAILANDPNVINREIETALGMIISLEGQLTIYRQKLVELRLASVQPTDIPELGWLASGH